MARAKRKITKKVMRAKRAAPKKKGLANVVNKDFLSDALTDVKRELTKLKIDKENLTTKMESVGRAMGRAKVEQARLRDELTRVVAREGIIQTRATNIRNKLTRVKERILKVARIKDDLGGESEQ